MDKTLSFAQGMRTSYRSMIPMAGAPDPVSAIKTIAIPTENHDHHITVRLYYPNQKQLSQALPVIIFAHGGCFISGDLDTHDVLVRAIANGAEAIVAYVDYRLAPEHPFPAGLDDMYTVLEWIYHHADTINADPERIAVCGDSAGANLVTVMTMMARANNGPKIAAQWLIYLYAASEGRDTASWAALGDTYFPTQEVHINSMQAYTPKEIDPATSYISPLNGHHEDLPPALIQVGALDPLKDENIAYHEALSKAGTPSTIQVYERQQHGFIQFFKDRTQHSEGARAVQEGIQFLRSAFGQ